VTAALGVSGGLTGAARMARNYQWETAAGVSLVLASVVFALLARLIHSDQRMFKRNGWRWTWFLLNVPLGCFVIGAATCILFLNRAPGDPDRPSVTAQTMRDVGGNVTSTATVGAGGLRANDKVCVLVTGVTRSTGKSRQICYSVIGPSQDGLVEHQFLRW
jgi:MFS family permease